MSAPNPSGAAISHSDLVACAERWLRRFAGCSIVVTETSCVSRTMEIPDAIGWRERVSVLIECKTSRSDFLADRKKKFREDAARGMGTVRYFLAPVGLLRPDELPAGWGLLELSGRTVHLTVGVHPKKTWFEQGSSFVHSHRAIDGETALLLSCMNRVRKALGESGFRTAIRTRLAPKDLA